MWEARAETETTAPSDAVWALWDDPRRWRDWHPQIAAVRGEGPLRVGAEARIRFRGSPRALRFRVTGYEPGRRLTDEARLPGARLGHEHRVEPRGEGSLIAHRVWFDGPAARLYGALMGRRMTASVREFGPRERAHVEP